MLRTPRDIEEFGEILRPEEAQEPILARPVRSALLEWLEEIWAEGALKEVNLRPRRKAIFDGPPGVGKTTLAHHLAARLGLPMLCVRAERVQSAYFSQSAAHIGALFDLAKTDGEPLMLFFDEVEGIASKRLSSDGGGRGHREDHNLMVNTFLTQLDAFDGFVIAATNKGADVDTAVWRRFEVQIALALPGQEERERILARYLDPFGLPASAKRRLAESLETATPALMRQFCEALKRQIVVGPLAKWNMQREVVIDRVLAAITPHPDLGRPRLWSLGAKDDAIRVLPWPLQRASDVTKEAELDLAGAEELGRKSAWEGRSIIDNPFAFGDARRPRFDEGYRKESGSDGMGGNSATDKVVKIGDHR